MAAREMNAVAGQDHAVGVERKVIVDKELGIAYRYYHDCSCLITKHVS